MPTTTTPADEYDFFAFGQPDAPVAPTATAPARVSTAGAGPKGLNTNDAAVAEADNRRARRPRRKAGA